MRPATPATAKQLAYLRTLVEATGEDYRAFLIDHGYRAAPCKSEASRLIDMLKNGRTAADARRIACDDDDMRTMGYGY
jgi:hypothetical protein